MPENLGDISRDIFVVPTYAPSQLDNARRMAELSAQYGFTPVLVCNSNTTASALADSPFSVAPGVNTGYGGAANFVASQLNFRTILICNDDLVFTDAGMRSLRASVLALGQTDDASLIGFLPETRPRIVPVPGVRALLALVSGLSAVTSRLDEWRARRALGGQGDGTFGEAVLLPDDLGFPFVCVAMTRNAWDELDGFDSRFPLYFEDADVLRRARHQGVTVRVTLGDCTHQHSSTSRAVLPYIVPLMCVGARNYLELHCKIARSIASLLVTLALAVRAVCWMPARPDRAIELRSILRAIPAVWSSTNPAMPPW